MKDIKKTDRAEYLYHNTELLLKKYRDVVWSIELSALHAEMKFELEMGCKLNDFLEMSYEAGLEFSGTQIQEQVRIMEQNKKMLNIIDKAVDMLRRRQADGEIYYWIIYYTYLSEKPLKKVEDIIKKVAEKTEYMAWKTYFKRRKHTISLLSTILWGYTSKECLPILQELIDNMI